MTKSKVNKSNMIFVQSLQIIFTVIIFRIGAHPLIPSSFNDIANSEITSFRGEILCNSQVAGIIFVDKNYQYDAWQLNINGGTEFKIFPDSNDTKIIYNIFGTDGILIGNSTVLLPNERSATFYIQIKANSDVVYKYNFKLVCNKQRNTSPQSRRLQSDSDDDSDDDDSSTSDDAAALPTIALPTTASPITAIPTTASPTTASPTPCSSVWSYHGYRHQNDGNFDWILFAEDNMTSSDD
eukprot:UN10445